MKQIIVVRNDLRMSKGKLAAQVAHASLCSLQNSDKKIAKEWQKQGQKKIVLKVGSLDQLMELEKKCKKLKIPFSLIADAGSTELLAGTVTCLGIGPDEDSKIDKVTGSLALLE
jgi:PTH2 family peptidyl-tRNA hydrolase